jgi:hypothetical protein
MPYLPTVEGSRSMPPRRVLQNKKDPAVSQVPADVTGSRRYAHYSLALPWVNVGVNPYPVNQSAAIW